MTDHVIFFGYRWLSWFATVGWLLAQGSLADYLALLFATGALNIFATLSAQRYIRMAQHSFFVMGIDVLYTVAVLMVGGGWNSPFTFYAYSSLVLPSLLFGWRGGVMAGLDFAALTAAALWAIGESPADLVAESGWASLARMMASPVLFGILLPGLIELLRRGIGQHARRRRAVPLPRLEREIGATPPRFIDLARPAGRARQSLPDDAPLAAQATKIRAAEQSVEDLRRVIFMPLPSMDMDLAPALDLLAMRFGQHTGATARVTLLGRTRVVSPIHRGLLVRLAQESLLNVQQHAHAASAVLTLRYDASSVSLLIQDDGVGLLDGTHERPGLHALRAMQYRLAEFGGRLDVFETEGGGVTVRATMPLE
ncbi:MAG TPA: histidine kinase [Roseiflexaceae bacterium]|nr:histidine kinase [Roseiflexaceae bacterium]